MSATDEAGAESKRHISWLTIIVSGAVTLIVSVTAGMIIFLLQSREPHLVYSAADTLPFSGQDRVVAVYQVGLGNDGKRSVDDVACVIRIPGATIQQTRVIGDPSLEYSHTATSDTLKLHISSLNPSENVQISLLASATGSIPAHPEVSLRAKGVMGEQKRSREGGRDPFFLGLSTSFTAAVSAFLVGAGLALRRRLAGDPTTRHGLHSDDQREVLSYVLRLHGLGEEADRLLSQTHEASYWAQADRIGQLAVDSGDPEKSAKLKAALLALLDYAEIVDSSRGIILYNLARMEVSSNQLVKASEYLKRATALAPVLVKKRLSIDPLLKDIKWQT